MSYQYDIAISFAEEDRNAALALALALRLQNVNAVYYYPLHYEATWGTQLADKLTSIYSVEARYAIILFSRKYFEKTFTKIELAAIQSRIEQDKSIVYMLPVLLEKTDHPEMLPFMKTGYFEWQYNAEEIAATITRLLGIAKAEVPPVQLLVFDRNQVDADHIDFNAPASAPDGSSSRIDVTNSTIASKTIRFGK